MKKLSLVLLVGLSVFAEPVYYYVRCADANADTVEKWLVGDQSSVTMTSDGKFLVKGSGIDLRSEKRKEIIRCDSRYGWHCTSQPNGAGGLHETCEFLYDKGWNVKVLANTGGDFMAYCGVGTTVESLPTKAAFLDKVYAAVYDAKNAKGIVKRECLIDETR